MCRWCAWLPSEEEQEGTWEAVAGLEPSCTWEEVAQDAQTLRSGRGSRSPC